jgi:nucleotide-binding universal stress UspA family protein
MTPVRTRTTAARSRRPEIVVGVDASPGCRAAVEFAVREAELRHAGLVAVMAVSHATHPDGDEPAEGRLRSFVDSVGTGALEVGLVVTTRPVAEALLDQSRYAELLVVGGHSSQVPRAHAVDPETLSQARCPVVVVRAPDQEAEPDNVARFI